MSHKKDKQSQSTKNSKMEFSIAAVLIILLVGVTVFYLSIPREGNTEPGLDDTIGDPQDQYMGKMHDGVRLYEAKDYEEALAKFKEVRKNHPDDALVNMFIGWCLHKTGNYNEAEEYFKRSIELDPQLKKAHFGLGSNYFELEQYKEAITNLEKALKVQEPNTEIYSELGWTYYRDGQYENALQNFKNSIGLDSSNTRALYGLGEVQFKLKNFEASKEAFEKLEEISGRDKNTVQWILRNELELKNTEQASSLLNKNKDLLDLQHDSKTQESMGEVYYQQEKYQESNEYFKKALDSNNPNEVLYYSIAWNYIMLNDTENATQYLQLGENEAPDAKKCWISVAKGMVAEEKETAQKYLNETLHLDEDCPEAIYLKEKISKT